ncbi:Hsp70 family protein [Frigidibacter sp. ROC022]|uniref:Hsp70 family protein n=1 Tax=Frigidibacter sp. ROC022 TaxID=2971796 RepID=UPI00215A600A|nr:Hsp70 family protein [Frigidibacter sp. ROC022]MCR8726527.1 Hsp70 family protein [Frigidibacter sp. ROC022]
MSDATLAIDFGTSTSAAAVLADGKPWRIPVETGADTLPTAVFFPAGGGAMRIGAAAARAQTAGDEGRYMRGLKSVLGTDLMHQTRLIAGRRLSLTDILSQFLATLKERAETATGLRFRRALSGRPVRFHSRDAARNARAEEDLRACYLAAGFEEVRFRLEPEAAALAAHGLGKEGETGIIVDIGGGTSDFSVYASDGGRPRILASHGIRLGGTDFDHAVSLRHIMPHLGHGGELRREFGPGLLPVPPALFVDLARWETIPFLYTPETRREAKAMAAQAVEPQKLGRLVTVLRDELGHDLAFAAERGKIAANGPEGAAQIGLGLVEPGLAAPIDRASLDAALSGFAGKLTEAAEQTLADAGVPADSIRAVILVGGSSLMSLVTDEMRTLFPTAPQHRTEAFTAVVDGLALATA